MAVVRMIDAPTFAVDGFHFTGLTAPSRGATELCTWRLEIEPNAKSDAHWLDHEEVFVVLDGSIIVSVAGESVQLNAGDALSIPAQTLLQLMGGGESNAHAVVCIPAGTQATMADGREVGTPPWAK